MLNVVRNQKSVHATASIKRAFLRLPLLFALGRVPVNHFATARESPASINFRTQSTMNSQIRGIIFDMDGTLTEHGSIDFSAMYSRNGLKRRPGSDILTLVTNLPTEAEREAAMQVILQEELLGIERMMLRPHLHDLVDSLRSANIKIALSTRNCELAFIKFLDKASLPPTTFTPALHRDSLGGINKPDAAVAHHILGHWELSPDEASCVWFVGDSVDDMQCGRDAGCRTCLIRTSDNGRILSSSPHLVDVVVEDLLHLRELIFNQEIP